MRWWSRRWQRKKRGAGGRAADRVLPCLIRPTAKIDARSHLRPSSFILRTLTRHPPLPQRSTLRSHPSSFRHQLVPQRRTPRSTRPPRPVYGLSMDQFVLPTSPVFPRALVMWTSSCDLSRLMGGNPQFSASATTRTWALGAMNQGDIDK